MGNCRLLKKLDPQLSPPNKRPGPFFLELFVNHQIKQIMDVGIANEHLAIETLRTTSSNRKLDKYKY